MLPQKNEPGYYIHGSSPEEQDRLSTLNTILNDGCMRELTLFPGQRILDVGSGLGQFTRRMAEVSGEEGFTLGIERDPAQLAMARKLATEAEQGSQAEFREGDATGLPLKEEDTCNACMESIEKWRNRPDAALWYGVCWAEGKRHV